jgi:hypothetical protein
MTLLCHRKSVTKSLPKYIKTKGLTNGTSNSQLYYEEVSVFVKLEVV